MSVFDWQRPAKATPSKIAPLAAETPEGLLLVHGNYLLSFDGYKPETAELTALYGTLQQRRHHRPADPPRQSARPRAYSEQRTLRHRTRRTRQVRPRDPALRCRISLRRRSPTGAVSQSERRPEPRHLQLPQPPDRHAERRRVQGNTRRQYCQAQRPPRGGGVKSPRSGRGRERCSDWSNTRPL